MQHIEKQFLTTEQIDTLLRTCFNMSDQDKSIVILVDVPDEKLPDSVDWQFRRKFALQWYEQLSQFYGSQKRVKIYYYPNVGANNGDLPTEIYIYTGNSADLNSASLIKKGGCHTVEEILESANIVIAMTQLSATAPLKILGRKHNFRGATMPNFTQPMIPALALDYQKVNKRVMHIKERLDKSISVEYNFSTNNADYQFLADTRNRLAHASSGLMHNAKEVGNLPSGESYIVPYEGEIEGNPSLSRGIIPVQFNEEIVLYKIEQNRACEILSDGEISTKERKMLIDEPAYGNIAELGFGVLDVFGVKPVGSILLDEKLGVHIAFGRSEHFGGIISPASFKKQENVIHIDRVYIPDCQRDIRVRSVIFTYEDGSTEQVLADDKYLF
ncbi:hypothetical protein KC799_01250 [candidate division KSB1 bacterium]|nr:hypothetical protein [candidate division KSB1 bacterium]